MNYIGPERDSRHGWKCGYAPLGTCCDKEVAFHGVTVSAEPELRYSFGVCAEHLMELPPECDYVHPHVTPCGIPGALFIIAENTCRIEFDRDELSAERVLVRATS